MRASGVVHSGRFVKGEAVCTEKVGGVGGAGCEAKID